jgi:hypothetical protein
MNQIKRVELGKFLGMMIDYLYGDGLSNKLCEYEIESFREELEG